LFLRLTLDACQAVNTMSAIKLALSPAITPPVMLILYLLTLPETHQSFSIHEEHWQVLTTECILVRAALFLLPIYGPVAFFAFMFWLSTLPDLHIRVGIDQSGNQSGLESGMNAMKKINAECETAMAQRIKILEAKNAYMSRQLKAKAMKEKIAAAALDRAAFSLPPRLSEGTRLPVVVQNLKQRYKHAIVNNIDVCTVLDELDMFIARDRQEKNRSPPRASNSCSDVSSEVDSLPSSTRRDIDRVVAEELSTIELDSLSSSKPSDIDRVVAEEMSTVYSRSVCREVQVSAIPFATPEEATHFHSQLIFIPEEATQSALDSRLTREHFDSSKALFSYLRWTIKMQQIDGLYRVLRLESHGRQPFEVVLFNTELHRRNTAEPAPDALDTLFIVGVRNDHAVSQIKWKMDAFASARQILEQYGIAREWLPAGSRAISRPFGDINQQRHCREMVVTGWLRRCGGGAASASALLASAVALRWCTFFYDPFTIALQGVTAETQLRQIKTLQKKAQHRAAPREMRVSWPDFRRFIGDAMRNGKELLRIVSFDKLKRAYHIDSLLPVRVVSDEFGENWIGILFRDNKPNAICLDCNDIRIRTKLFDAQCDVRRFGWLRNQLTRLTVYTPYKHAPRVRARAQSYRHQTALPCIGAPVFSPATPPTFVQQNTPARHGYGNHYGKYYCNSRQYHGQQQQLLQVQAQFQQSQSHFAQFVHPAHYNMVSSSAMHTTVSAHIQQQHNLQNQN